MRLKPLEPNFLMPENYSNKRRIHLLVMNVKEHILAAIHKCLAKNLPASGKAILFGSQARGTAREDSDWDILIILDKENSWLPIMTTSPIR
mgnify:CR=1 FL=1